MVVDAALGVARPSNDQNKCNGWFGTTTCNAGVR
ncbi:hypothetical protein FHY31_002474 [Xanthomonas euvesicatoria]|uniref:Uncharacterized protein n=1 Tax=Xanthomonas euvesicatoria TaxID=456327 RepID=A0AAW3U3M4_XANEU|nr:hypothetical protein [Xanthomonas euvesicatoria]MBB4870712.1 hypothetical protein [Xanthomonas euvesicatoria]